MSYSIVSFPFEYFDLVLIVALYRSSIDFSMINDRVCEWEVVLCDVTMDRFHLAVRWIIDSMEAR